MIKDYVMAKSLLDTKSTKAPKKAKIKTEKKPKVNAANTQPQTLEEIKRHLLVYVGIHSQDIEFVDPETGINTKIKKLMSDWQCSYSRIENKSIIKSSDGKLFEDTNDNIVDAFYMAFWKFMSYGNDFGTF